MTNQLEDRAHQFNCSLFAGIELFAKASSCHRDHRQCLNTRTGKRFVLSTITAVETKRKDASYRFTGECFIVNIYLG